jgi:transposase
MLWSRTPSERKKHRILRTLANLPPRSVILVQDEIDLLLFPPLQASWSPRGKPHRVLLRGQNAKRVLFGTLNIRTGRRLLLARERQRAVDFCAFLERIHGHYRAWHVVLLLDEDSSHTAKVSQALAHRLGIGLEWLPKRSPHLNPVDHLWRDATHVVLANRRHQSIDALVTHTLDYLYSLTPQETLRKAGLLSPDFWLRDIL